MIGCVAAGSLFATAQAVAMGAGIHVLVKLIVGVVTAVLAMVVAAFVCVFEFLSAQ